MLISLPFILIGVYALMPHRVLLQFFHEDVQAAQQVVDRQQILSQIEYGWPRIFLDYAASAFTIVVGFSTIAIGYMFAKWKIIDDHTKELRKAKKAQEALKTETH